MLTAFLMPVFARTETGIFYKLNLCRRKDIQMKINELRIDPASLGKTKMLADIRPYYNYTDNSKDIEGYKYKVVLPAHKMDAIEVKIPGAKLLELADGEFPIVEFENLEIKAYFIEGKELISATAKSLRVIGNQHKS